jgi:hypothetical protein
LPPSPTSRSRPPRLKPSRHVHRWREVGPKKGVGGWARRLHLVALPRRPAQWQPA